jgi:Tfp pilus assembly protein PilN
MTQVNLLPSDVHERQTTRRTTTAAVIAVAAVVALLVFVFMLQVGRLTSANHDLDTQNQANATIQSQITSLEQFEQLKQTLSDRETMVATLLSQQVLWSGVLRDVSMVVPGQLWLTNFSGALSTSTPVAAVPPPAVAPSAAPTDGSSPAPAPAAAPVAPPASSLLVGQLTFSGTSFDQPTLSLWLKRLEQVKGWENAWVSQSATTLVAGQQLYTFTSSVDLSAEAVTGGPK